MSHVREGFRTLTPYVTIDDPAGLKDFIEAAFDAETLHVSRDGDRIANIQMRIGDSMLEIGGATEQWSQRPASIHMYVEDTDAVYARAIEAGARSLWEPSQMPYGERSGGVEDAWGNYWYVATMTE